MFLIKNQKKKYAEIFFIILKKKYF